MASFYHYNTYHQPSSGSHSSLSMMNHNNRSRRVNRLAQDSQKPQIRAVRKEEEPIIVTSFRQRFEAGRSFDLDDDMEFCPSLLTECDMSNQSPLSDRASFSSESPNSSPQAYQVSPSFNYYSNPTPYLPATQTNNAIISKYKDDIHSSTRSRNAIHIINPNAINDSTRSPERQAQNFERRW